MSTAIARGIVWTIQMYRHMVSPLRPPTCRFIPTCSQYAVAALTEHGLFRGGWLSVLRLCKCGPWHKGGWDPIPERRHNAHDSCVHAGDSPDVQGLSGAAPAVRAGSETRV